MADASPMNAEESNKILEQQLLCNIQENTNINTVIQCCEVKDTKHENTEEKGQEIVKDIIKSTGDVQDNVDLEAAIAPLQIDVDQSEVEQLNLDLSDCNTEESQDSNEQNVSSSTESCSTSNVITQDEWEKRESALLEKISLLEKQGDDTTMKGLQIKLQVKCEENEILKAKVVNMQTELSALMKKPNGKNKDIVSKIKKQHEDLLTKAKGMIFDKTKMIKNQELQIEALTTQVSSLKEVVSITKNLLEIRNMEVTHLQDRLQVMDMKLQAEKERHNLMIKKIDSGTMLNAQLKIEYEKQLVLFKELKRRYEEKFVKLEQQLNSQNGAPSTSE